MKNGRCLYIGKDRTSNEELLRNFHHALDWYPRWKYMMVLGDLSACSAPLPADAKRQHRRHLGSCVTRLSFAIRH